MFFGFFKKKKINGFFGCSRFLVLENLENPKNTMCFFWIFPVFIEKSKKKQWFFWIFLGFHRKIQQNYSNFVFSKFLLLEILENPKKSIFVFLDFRLF